MPTFLGELTDYFKTSEGIKSVCDATKLATHFSDNKDLGKVASCTGDLKSGIKIFEVPGSLYSTFYTGKAVVVAPSFYSFAGFCGAAGGFIEKIFSGLKTLATKNLFGVDGAVVNPVADKVIPTATAAGAAARLYVTGFDIVNMSAATPGKGAVIVNRLIAIVKDISVLALGVFGVLAVFFGIVTGSVWLTTAAAIVLAGSVIQHFHNVLVVKPAVAAALSAGSASIIAA